MLHFMFPAKQATETICIAQYSTDTDTVQDLQINASMHACMRLEISNVLPPGYSVGLKGIYAA